MTGLFTSADIALLLRLLTAHILTDFVIQNRGLLDDRFEKKWRSYWLYVHSVIAGILAYVLAGLWGIFWLPIVILFSHFLLDGIKSHYRNCLLAFVLDQAGHVLVLTICWLLLVNAQFFEIFEQVSGLFGEVKFWTHTLAFILILSPTGIVISKLTYPFRKAIKEESPRGLKSAGMWIGCLERVLVLIFVLAGKYDAIGFLVAAKSIFRFADIKGNYSRSIVEYFLIGTFLSLIFAVIIGLILKAIIAHWG